MIESITIVNDSISQYNRVTIDKKTGNNFVLNEANLGTIEGKHQSSKYIGQVGEYVSYSSMGTRSISISGWVIGASESDIRNSKAILNRLVNPLDELKLEVFDCLLFFKPDSTIKYSSSYNENNEVLCKFIIQGTAFAPLFVSQNGQTVDLAYEVPVFHFPLVIPEDGIVMSYREPALIKNVYNAGDVETGVEIIIVANGAVKNPTIINASTNEFFRINKVLEAGERISICTSSGEEKVLGKLNEVEMNYFEYIDLDSTWLQLNVGDTLLKYDADENINLMEVTLKFTEKYLEVQ